MEENKTPRREDGNRVSRPRKRITQPRKSVYSTDEAEHKSRPSQGGRKPYRPAEGGQGGERRPYRSAEHGQGEERHGHTSFRASEQGEGRPVRSGAKRTPVKKSAPTSRGAKVERPRKAAAPKQADGQRTWGNGKPRKPRQVKPVGPKPKKVIPETARPNPANEGTTRLNRYISNAGICSRREADKLIAAGAVSVNGVVVTEMGYKVLPTDVVSYGGETLRSEAKRYFLLNKPKGFITTTDDPQERRTVMQLIEGACKERIYPVGRLDRDTTGLLLFTNDGELAKKLMHPSTGIYKIYQVELDHPVTRDDMRVLREGVELEDGPMHFDDIQYANISDDKRIVGVELHSGRNRIVRRMFESLGYGVHKLDRTVFAGLTKKDLPRGRYRELTEKEIGFLKMI